MENYADVLESYVIVEEGFGDIVKKAGKAIWNFLRELIRKIREKISSLIQKIKSKKLPSKKELMRKLEYEKEKNRYKDQDNDNRRKQWEDDKARIYSEWRNNVDDMNQRLERTEKENLRLSKDNAELTKENQRLERNDENAHKLFRLLQNMLSAANKGYNALMKIQKCNTYVAKITSLTATNHFAADWDVVGDADKSRRDTVDFLSSSDNDIVEQLSYMQEVLTTPPVLVVAETSEPYRKFLSMAEKVLQDCEKHIITIQKWENESQGYKDKRAITEFKAVGDFYSAVIPELNKTITAINTAFNK